MEWDNMRLIFLERLLRDVHDKMEYLTFSSLIRQSRDALGIKQYRASEFMGITHSRLKNLETGYFRNMPDYQELAAISILFDIDVDILENKAEDHVLKRCKEKKTRLFKDKRR